jgi:hypothetical protein
LTRQQTLRLIDDCALKKQRFIPAERAAFRDWLKRLAELAEPGERLEIRGRIEKMEDFPTPETIPTTDWTR